MKGVAVMNKEFEARVKFEGVVDTKKYRYVYKVRDGIRKSRIIRIEISKLDTTAALNEWEVVKEYE